VLAGQPEFDRRLDARNLRQLKQRIVLRCALRPFTEAETREYVPTRLKQAGMPDQTVFPPDLLVEIHVHSRGIPRLINAVCDNLLLTAFALQSKVATTEMLAEVIQDLHLGADARSTVWSRHFAERGSNAVLARRNRTLLNNAAMDRLGTERPRLAGKKRNPGFERTTPAAPGAEQSSPPVGLHASCDGETKDPPSQSRSRTDAEDRAQFRFEVKPWNQMAETTDQASPESPVPISETKERTESRFKVMTKRVSLTLAAAARTVAAVAETAAKTRRTTLVWLTALACVSLIAPFSKPVLRRLAVRAAAVSWGGHTQTAVVEPANANARIRTNADDVPPRPLRIDPAEYTPTARYAGFRGKVFVVVRVDPQGQVTGVEFTAPTAYDLDEPVREVARRWRFKPALRDGETVESRILVQVPFK
jgi:TonB family protein